MPISEKPTPRYPPFARRMHVEGTVHLRIEIGIDGRVENIVPFQGEADPILVASAMEAARQWRFKPALNQEGVPTECWVVIPIYFRLEQPHP